MKTKVYEYELNESNFIISWLEHNGKKRPDLIGNPFPLPEMVLGIIDVYGNPIYKLINNEIIKVTPTPSQSQIKRKQFNSLSKVNFVKALIAGIKNGPDDPLFISLAEIVEEINII